MRTPTASAEAWFQPTSLADVYALLSTYAYMLIPYLYFLRPNLFVQLHLPAQIRHCPSPSCCGAYRQWGCKILSRRPN
jgi:hypothetical protein